MVTYGSASGRAFGMRLRRRSFSADAAVSGIWDNADETSLWGERLERIPHGAKSKFILGQSGAIRLYHLQTFPNQNETLWIAPQQSETPQRSETLRFVLWRSVVSCTFGFLTKATPSAPKSEALRHYPPKPSQTKTKHFGLLQNKANHFNEVNHFGLHFGVRRVRVYISNQSESIWLPNQSGPFRTVKRSTLALSFPNQTKVRRFSISEQKWNTLASFKTRRNAPTKRYQSLQETETLCFAPYAALRL